MSKKSPDEQLRQWHTREAITHALHFVSRRYDISLWFSLVAVLLIGGTPTLIGWGVGKFLPAVYFNPIGSASLSLLLLSIISFGLFWLVVATMNIALHSNDSIRFWASLRTVVTRLWPLLIVGAYTQLLVLAGFILLIIPAVVVNVYLTFALYVALYEDRSGLDAVTRSVHLVQGNFWRLVWQLVVVTAPITAFFYLITIGLERIAVDTNAQALIIILFVLLLSVSIAVFMVAYTSRLARRYIHEKPVFDEVSQQFLARWVRYGIGLGLLVLFVGIPLFGWYIVNTVQVFETSQSSATVDFTVEEYNEALLTIPGRHITALTDDRITMFDVWFELDWYYSNTAMYPDTLFLLDLLLIPDGLQYEQINDGEGFRLCRNDTLEECVTDSDAEYPFID